MGSETLKQKIIEFSREIGIDKIGFTSAAPFPELRNILLNHRELGYESGFEEKDIDKRINPKHVLESAQSIIAIAVAYPAKMVDAPKSVEGSYRGFVSRSAWGLDYHHVLEERLKQLGEYITCISPGAEYEYMTDTGVLSDHAVAERAGIGWIGKNSLLITEEFGSYVYLGELVTNIYLPEDRPIDNNCGDCTRCLQFCPTNAIVNPGQVNAKQCLSFITQSKDFIEEEYMQKLGNRVYGCDTCQMVCPYNKGINSIHQEHTLPDNELAKPLLRPLLRMTNKEFKNNWGNTAAAWRGKKPIQRNAIIALAHFKDKTALPDLEWILLNDERPMIRRTVAWAIGKIGGEFALVLLERMKKREKDAHVLSELEKSINKLLNQTI